MRNFTVTILLASLMAMSFVGCGNTNTEVNEAVQENSVEQESNTEITTEEDSEDIVKIVDNGMTFNWIDNDRTNVGATVYLKLQNLTDDKVIKNPHYQFVAEKSDGTVVETAEMYCDYIAPGEIGILTAEIEFKYADIEDINGQSKYVSGDIVNADSVEYVPQSSIEVSGVNAEKTDIDTIFRGTITNNSDIVMNDATIVVVGKKDGKISSIVTDYMLGETIGAGASISFEILGTTFMHDDYEEYEVYVTNEL